MSCKILYFLVLTLTSIEQTQGQLNLKSLLSRINNQYKSILDKKAPSSQRSTTEASTAFSSRYESSLPPVPTSIRSSIRSSAYKSGLENAGNTGKPTLAELLARINKAPESSRTRFSETTKHKPSQLTSQSTKGFTQKLKPQTSTKAKCLMGGTDCKDDATKEPTYPELKFVTESSWDSDIAGGYIATLWVPIYENTENWNVRMVFNEPITQAKNWQFTPEFQTSSDNRTLQFLPKDWNKNLYQGNMLKVRYMLEYNKNEEANQIQNYSPRPVVHFQDRNFDFHVGNLLKSEAGAADGSDGSPFGRYSGITITKSEESENEEDETFESSLTQLDSQVNTKEANTKCLQKRSEDEKRCTGLRSSCFITQCDPKTGNFISHQCWARLKICWCLNSEGKKLVDTLKRDSIFDKSACNMKIASSISSSSSELSSLLQRIRPQYQTNGPEGVISPSSQKVQISRSSFGAPGSNYGVDRSRLTRTNSYSHVAPPSNNILSSRLIPIRSYSKPFGSEAPSESARLKNLILKMNDVTGSTFKSKVQPLGLKGNFRAGSFQVFGGRR